MSDIAVEHDSAGHRFVARLGHDDAVAVYQLNGTVITMTHTVVPQTMEGRGIAGQLVAAALAYAREQGFKVIPQCIYVQAYMRRHPESADLLA